MTAEGVLLLDSREHRTQAQNREAARARLVALCRRRRCGPSRDGRRVRDAPPRSGG